MSDQKILIIGLDGCSWKVFEPLIEAGAMPNLKQLVEQGCCGELRSTEPPVTPTAWTTMMTGVQANQHGVYGFEQYDPKTGQVRLTNSKSIRFITMWEHLSKLGYQVASLNVPQTYPPFEVNGVMVSGYGCPGKQYDYAYPEELKAMIDEHVPDYDMVLHWKKGDINDTELLKNNLKYCMKAFDGIVGLAELVEEQYGWDVMLAEIQQMDLVQHHIYGYLSPDTHKQHPQIGEMVIEMIGHLDGVIGKLASKAVGEKDLVILASDHGLTAFKAKVKPNNYLKEWGYLKPMGAFDRMAGRLKKNFKFLAGSNSKIVSDISEKLSFDLKRTQAYVAHAAQHAYLYINEETVGDPQAKEKLINDLKQRFLSVTNPLSGEKLFSRVETPEDLFHIGSEAAAGIADLVLIANDGYLPVRTMHGGHVIEPAVNSVGGSHSYDGMYLIAGRTIREGVRLNAHISDIAPTVYAALGVELPKGIDGHVLQEAFKEPLAIKNSQGDSSATAGSKAQSASLLDENEEQIVQQRLADLGYLE